MRSVEYKDRNVRIYRRYTEWLKSLPEAHEVGYTNHPSGSRFSEYVYRIDGFIGEWLVGSTGMETADSVIASLPQGNLLKARVFIPLHRSSR